MANTTKLKPRRVNSFNEPSEGKNLWYKNDDQFKWQDWPWSWWYQSFFKTQDEYDALPASKENDWNLYIIVDTHIYFIPFEGLIELEPKPDAILDELNQDGKGYAEYYYGNDDIDMEEAPSSELPRADAYVKEYSFELDGIPYGYYSYVDTNLTEQELEDSPFAEFTEDILAWKWVFKRR